MANNRLYLVDGETGDFVTIAKGFGEWGLRIDSELLDAFLEAHDFGGAQGGRTGLRLADDNDAEISVRCVRGESWKPDPTRRPL